MHPLSFLFPLLLGGLAAAGCSASANEAPDVLLVCIDTLRADHLGCYGYEVHPTSPRLDALAAESLVFADASAAAGWTKPSVPSFMTGTYPAQHGVYEGSSKDGAGRVSHVLPEDAVTLAEVFRDRGYATAAFVQNAQLRLGQGIEQGFETYVDRAGDARAIRWQALDWLDAQHGDKPFFLYVHLLDAHWPYPVPEDFATSFASAEEIAPYRVDDWKTLRDAINDGEVAFGEQDRLALESLYDGAIRYADRQLGLLFDGLRLRDDWQETVVCVVSDHGEEFGEHGRIGHGHGLWENLLSVPWILRVPGRAPARIETPVSLVDLFPTLCAASGIVAPDTATGLDRIARPEAPAEIFAEHKAPDRYQQSLRVGDRKLVRHFRANDEPERDRWPVVVGKRWEAELSRHPSGRLRVTQLERRDEPADEPAELKGIVTELGPDHVAVGGIRLALGPDTAVRGSEETTGFEAGVLVKVRIAEVDGIRTAERIKLYPPDTEPEFELRGAVTEKSGEPGEGRLTIAGIPVLVDGETRFEDVDERPCRLERERLRRFLLGERGPADEVRLELRGLSPERGLEPSPESTAGLEARLDRLAGHLARTGFWSSDDETALSAEEVRSLEAIGYVE